MITRKARCAGCRRMVSTAINILQPHLSPITLMEVRNEKILYYCRRCHDEMDAEELEKMLRQRTKPAHNGTEEQTL